jgi:hypothetical protein
MKVDPHLVADPHWRILAFTLHDAHSRRVDVPDAITVALEDGPLNPDAPAADLAGRIQRLNCPEPFIVDPDSVSAEARNDGFLQGIGRSREGQPFTW